MAGKLEILQGQPGGYRFNPEAPREREPRHELR